LLAHVIHETEGSICWQARNKKCLCDAGIVHHKGKHQVETSKPGIKGGLAAQNRRGFESPPPGFQPS